MDNMSSIIKFEDISSNKVYGTYYFILGFIISIFFIQIYIPDIINFDFNQKIITIALIGSFLAIFFNGISFFQILSKFQML